MDFEAAKGIYFQINQTKQTVLMRRVVDAAVRYARLRVDHLLAAADRQPMLGHERSAAHNAFIAACNTLAGAMADNGEDASWRRALGQDRKTIGSVVLTP